LIIEFSILKILNQKKNRLIFQLLSISLVSFFVILTNFLRSNKKVFSQDIQEDLTILIPGISSVKGLSHHRSDVNGSVPPSDAFKDLFKYTINIPFMNKTKLIESKNAISSLPKFYINIPYDNYDYILKDRLLAINKGFLYKPKWVKGTISDEDKFAKSNFRLKGDLSDHWYSNKRLSFKVKLNKNYGSLNGMNNFYLHKLRSRTYPFSYLFQELISDFGFHSVEHKLVNVNVNNSYWGLMDMQDTFGTRLMAKNKLRESLIVRFSDDYYWKNYLRSNDNPLPRKEYWLSHPRLFIDSVSIPYSKLNGKELLQFNYITNFIKKDGYQDIIFNQRMLSEAEEILAIWGNFHAAGLNNMYFYFNPFTLKLEPIMTDQGRFQDIEKTYKEKSIQEVTYGFLRAKKLQKSERSLLQDKTMVQIKKLIPYKLSRKYFPSDRILNLDYVNSNFNFLKNNKGLVDYKGREKLLYTDMMECKTNQYKILDLHTLNASFNKNHLNLYPLTCGEFLIKEINLCNKNTLANLKFNPKKIILSKPKKVKISSFMNSNSIEFNNCNSSQNFIIYEHQGNEKNLSLNFLPDLDIELNPLRKLNFPKFIKRNSLKKFIFQEGEWIIKEPIVIDGDLEIRKNTSLIFAPDTYMIVKGGLIIEGEEGNPVKMVALEKEKGWKGLYVYNDQKQKISSNIKSLLISDTKETNVGILSLTGGLTFYNSNLVVDDLTILNSNAEDGINIVNSLIDINGLNISQSKSDGLDCDFCSGNIKQVYLNEIGGDGLDFSGSDINGKVNMASNVKDKVISIGEESEVNFDVENVTNSYLVAAIKDGSRSKIKLNNIETSGNIIMAYVKKDFYTKRTNVEISYSQNQQKLDLKRFITTEDADLYVNKIKINPSVLDIKALYNTGPMKK